MGRCRCQARVRATATGARHSDAGHVYYPSPTPDGPLFLPAVRPGTGPTRSRSRRGKDCDPRTCIISTEDST